MVYVNQYKLYMLLRNIWPRHFKLFVCTQRGGPATISVRTNNLKLLDQILRTSLPPRDLTVLRHHSDQNTGRLS